MLRLCEYGVPWAVAWKLTPVRRLAYLIAGGEARGGEFDWDRMRWKEGKGPPT